MMYPLETDFTMYCTPGVRQGSCCTPAAPNANNSSESLASKPQSDTYEHPFFCSKDVVND